MGKFFKIILFFVVVAGIGIYFYGNYSSIFKATGPKENVLTQTNKSVIPSTGAPIDSYTPPQTVIAPQIPDSQIPSGFTRSQLSPYFQKIRFSSVYASYYGYSSQISLYSSLTNNEKADITGWRIKSNHGEILIPKAVNIYEPSGFSAEEDIVLSANNNVNIYGNTSPISRNLRLNKCTGYLQDTYKFNPALPQNCPSISNFNYLSGQCQTYINSLYGCKLPDASFYNLLPGTNEGNACRQFLDTINQSSCFEKHRYDADFLSNEWRVWVNQNILDTQHDKILLYDKQGLLVDQNLY